MNQSLYVQIVYLEYMAYVEAIIHSQTFPLYCIVFQTCLCQTWFNITKTRLYQRGFSIPEN